MMETADQANSAIETLLNLTNKFLVVTAKKSKKIDVTVTDSQVKNREVREIFL
jgi:hypothetical protein